MPNSYASYDFYLNNYNGSSISVDEFGRLMIRASAIIDQVTFDRAGLVITADTDTAKIESIKMAACAVAEELQTTDTSGGSDGITSEHIGNYSVSYGAGSNKAKTTVRRASDAAKLWLARTGLMYRGFEDGEYSGVIT